MKLILPCIAARSISLTPSGMARSALVAPAKGGTSGQRLLTVPAFSPPVSDSTIRQETTAPKRRRRAKSVVDFWVTVLEFIFIASSRAKTIVDSRPAIQKLDDPARNDAVQKLKFYVLLSVPTTHAASRPNSELLPRTAS